MDFLKKNFVAIVLALLVINMIATVRGNTKTTRAKNAVINLEAQVLNNKAEIKNNRSSIQVIHPLSELEMKKLMFEFFLYEQELDAGKITPTQIRERWGIE